MPFIKPRNQKPASSLATRARSASGKVWTSVAQHAKQFWDWLPRLRRWLSELLLRVLKAVWLPLSGLVLAGLVAWLFASELQDGIRFFGLFLQLLGVGTVAYGLYDVHEKLGLPSLKERIAERVKRFPKYAPKPTQLGPEGSGWVEIYSSDDRHIDGFNPDKPVEERLNALEKALNELWRWQEETSNKASMLGTAIEDERRKRKGGDQENADLLKELSTGGLSIEWMGLVWLFVGIVRATIPEEIASFF